MSDKRPANSQPQVVAQKMVPISDYVRPKPVRLYRFRVWFWDRVMLETSSTARLRWRQRNAEEPQVCKCGQPAAWAVFYRGPGSMHRLYGEPVYYHCEEHKNVSLSAPWEGLPDGTYRPMVNVGGNVWA